MESKRIAIAGSTGLVGGRLVPYLQQNGYDVLELVRREPRRPNEVRWDPAKGSIDAAALEGVDAVINMAGVSIASKRWSEATKQAILKSRLDATSLIANTITSLRDKPGVLVSTSAVGFYGDGGDRVLTEQSPRGDGFLASVCAQWEAAADPAANAGIRVVHPRFGVVLAREGGLLPQISLPFRFGLGGKIAGGNQYQSWIDIDDLVRVLHFLVERADIEGPVNTVAPEPATNAEFTGALGKALHRPTIVPIPAFGIELLKGQMGKELILVSQRATPTRLEQAGFDFLYPTIETSLNHQLTTEVASPKESVPREPRLVAPTGNAKLGQR